MVSLFYSLQLALERSLLSYPPLWHLSILEPYHWQSWFFSCSSDSSDWLWGQSPVTSCSHQRLWLLALRPPARQKPARLSSQVAFSRSCCSPRLKKMDWTRQMNTWANDSHWVTGSHPTAAGRQAEVSFPPSLLSISQLHTKENCLASRGFWNY